MDEGSLKGLPIETVREGVIACDAPYLIVIGEPGSGTTSCVPQWYWMEGGKPLVAQPVSDFLQPNAARVSELMGFGPGTNVGFRGMYRSNRERYTEILFCLDRLPVIIEEVGNGFDTLILDEVEGQWSPRQSIAEAWCWKRITNGDFPFKRVVVLSSVLAADELAQARGNAPIFRSVGRPFPVEDRPPKRTAYQDVKALTGEGYDVLVFLAGWKEIMEQANACRYLDAELLPYHGSGALRKNGPGYSGRMTAQRSFFPLPCCNLGCRSCRHGVGSLRWLTSGWNRRRWLRRAVSSVGLPFRFPCPKEPCDGERQEGSVTAYAWTAIRERKERSTRSQEPVHHCLLHSVLSCLRSGSTWKICRSIGHPATRQSIMRTRWLWRLAQ